MNRIGKALVVLAVLAISALAFIGCSGPAASTRGTNGAVAHPKEYYEGIWACAAVEADGEMVRYTELTDEQKKSFPYLIMELKDGSLGTVTDVVNGGSSPEVLLMGEWEATGNGISIDGAEFTLDGSDLVSQQRSYKLYFDKCVSGSQLNVGTIAFDGITFDAPIELAYVYDGLKAQGETSGIIDSYRSDGPTVMLMSKPTEFSDITEMSDYFAGHEDCFTSLDGMGYFVRYDEANCDSNVEFIFDGKWYNIDFAYSEKDPVDYRDYAATFYTTIKASGAGAAPAGAIPWQEAPQHIGETVTVYGPVKDSTYLSESNERPTYIDIGAAYPDDSRVTMVVWGEDRGNFPDDPESMYLGKTVCVTGELYAYDDATYVKVASPDQVTVLG